VRGKKVDGTICNDQSVCTTGDRCIYGECVGTPLPGIDDRNICTTDYCNPATGAITHPAVVVNDGNAPSLDFTLTTSTSCTGTPRQPRGDE
jgi:hypothetical protein